MHVTSSGKLSASAAISTRSSTLMGSLIQTDGTNNATATIYDSTLGTLTLQNIVLTSLPTIAASTSNKITLAFTGGATAGAEVVTVSGNAISVQIETAVSTATQVKAALDAKAEATALVTIATTGTASTAQVVASAVRITGADGTADILQQATVVGADRYGHINFHDTGVASTGGLYLSLSGTGASAIVYYQK